MNETKERKLIREESFDIYSRYDLSIDPNSEPCVQTCDNAIRLEGDECTFVKQFDDILAYTSIHINNERTLESGYYAGCRPLDGDKFKVVRSILEYYEDDETDGENDIMTDEYCYEIVWRETMFDNDGWECDPYNKEDLEKCNESSHSEEGWEFVGLSLQDCRKLGLRPEFAMS